MISVSNILATEDKTEIGLLLSQFVLLADLRNGEIIAILKSSENIPIFIDVLKIVVNDGAIISAASLRSLPDILSYPADLDVLTVDGNLYILSTQTFCIMNCASGIVTYDSGVFELRGIFSASREATSLKCKFKAFAIIFLSVKFWLSCWISDIRVVFVC